MSAPKKSAGFTLLEVMVAVIILAVGLSSLFTSQVGAIRIAQRGRTTTIASLLARCKMGEVEEKIAKEGWPANDIDGDDKCCEGAEHDGFTCTWKVERIVLPDLTTEEGSEDALDKMKEGGANLAGGSDPSAVTPGVDPTTTPALDPAAAMGVPLSGGLDSMLTGGGLGDDSGGGDPMAQMVMSYAFPVMKPLIEEQVRRATVYVNWKEGSKDQTLDVVQFLVNEQPVLAADDEEEDVNAPATGTGTGTDGTGTGTGGSNNTSGGNNTATGGK